MKDNLQEIEMEEKVSSGTFFLFSDNPLQEIQKDLEMLIKKCGTMKKEIFEIQNEYETNIKKMILEFIHFTDAFEDTIEHIQPSVNLNFNNFVTLLKMLHRTLSNCNVSIIEVKENEIINPYFHFIIETVPKADKEDGTIIRVIKKGYLWKGKLIRPAYVIAVKN